MDTCCLTICAVVLGFVQAGRFERQLLELVFSKSDPDVRPAVNEGDVIDLSIGINLHEIVDVDEKNQVIKLSISIEYQWIDYQLHWNPQDYDNTIAVIVPENKIWKPDVILFNSVTESFNTFYPARATVYANGTVVWKPPAIVTSTCEIVITYFPFDEQKCHLNYGAWTYTGSMLDIHAGKIDIQRFISGGGNGEWRLIDMYPEKVNSTFNGEIYYNLKFYIRIRRRSLYYGLNIIIPALLISLMTLAIFILPPDSGEKLTLGITIFMSLCLFLLMVTEILPPTSSSIPLIGVYFSTVMVIVSASQILSVLVLNFANRSPATYTMSDTMEKVFLHWLPYCLMMRRPGYVSHKMHLYEERILFRDKLTLNHPIVVVNKNILTERNSKKSMKGNKSIHWLEQIANELAFISKRIDTEDADEHECGKWQFASMVLDRLLLTVFLGVIFSCTCSILFISPFGLGT